ncbi:MAG: T9SS type A sorting domain-containing protein, partial [Bacteroidales bacterium]|nr:T9SS type A sorting domain-containing protein [Bacteroidales bacterium]
KIDIVDLKGVTVYKSHKESIGHTMVNVSFLPQGSYIARLITKDSTSEFKFIKL